MKRILAIATAAVMIALGLFYWNTQTPSDSIDRVPEPLSDAPLAPPSNTSPAKPETTPYQVKIDEFVISVNANGNLVPAPEIRELFDKLAREQGQIPADLWKDSILEAHRNQLGDQAYEQLETLLNRYVEYNLALQMLPMDGVADLASALDRVRQIRNEYLGDASNAMFSDWQQVESFTEQFVSQVVNSQDVAQLQQTLQEQVYALPATVQPRAQKVLDQSQDLFQALTSSQADPATLRSIAEQTAALALVQPDFTFGEPTAQFMEQYTQYNAAKQNLQQQSAITSEDDPRLQQLRQDYFSGSDVLRVKTLDRAEMY